MSNERCYKLHHRDEENSQKGENVISLSARLNKQTEENVMGLWLVRKGRKKVAKWGIGGSTTF